MLYPPEQRAQRSVDLMFTINIDVSAMRGKHVFGIQSDKSTDLITEAGRKRCGSAKTLHGRETRAIRAKRSETLAELKVLGQQIRRWQVKL